MQAINIKLLKGTHDVLAHMHDAPFWGLSFLEKGIAEQWYRTSIKYQKQEFEKISFLPDQENSKSIMLKILSEQKNSETQNLVFQLFHIAGDSFALTNALNNPVRQLNPKDIGRVMRLVRDCLDKVEGKKLDPAQQENLKKLLQLSLTTIRGADGQPLKGLGGKPFKVVDFNPFVNALVGALQESLGSDNVYPQGTPQGLLLAYMIAKSNTRQDLQDYFSGFEGKAVDIGQAEYSKEELSLLFEKTPDLDNRKELGDFVSAVIYKQKYTSDLPKLSWGVSLDYQGYILSDCVESLMLNMANIVTYNKEQQLLGRPSYDIKMSNELRAFYDNSLNSNPSEVNNIKVHQDWGNLVENMVGVSYMRVGAGGKDKPLDVVTLCDGVIPVTAYDSKLPKKAITISGTEYQLQEIQVGSKLYWLVPQSLGLFCFEMMPTASNIIVVMNKLFDLKLYDSIEAVFAPTFVTTYFKSICSKFGWELLDDAEDKIIKYEEGSLKTIEIPIQVSDQNSFDLTFVQKQHGHVSVKEFFDLNLPAVSSQLVTAATPTQGVCLALGFDKKLLDSMPVSLQYFVPVLVAVHRTDFINQSLGAQTDDFALRASYIAQLIMSLIYFPDSYERTIYQPVLKDSPAIIQKALLFLAEGLFIKYGEIETMCRYFALLQQQGVSKNIDDLWLMVATQIESGLSGKNIDESWLRSAECLIEGNLLNAQQIQIIARWIDRGLKHPDQGVQLAAAGFIESSLRAGHFLLLDKSLLWSKIVSLMNSSDTSVKYNTFNFIQTFIEKDFIELDQIKDLQKWIERDIEGQDDFLSQRASDILWFLLDKGKADSQELSKLLQMVQKAFPIQDFYRYDSTLNFIIQLIGSGTLSQKDINVILTFMYACELQGDHQFNRKVLTILDLLIRKKMLNQESVSVALKILERITQINPWELISANFNFNDFVIYGNLNIEQIDRLLHILSFFNQYQMPYCIEQKNLLNQRKLQIAQNSILQKSLRSTTLKNPQDIVRQRLAGLMQKNQSKIRAA